MLGHRRSVATSMSHELLDITVGIRCTPTWKEYMSWRLGTSTHSLPATETSFGEPRRLPAHTQPQSATTTGTFGDLGWGGRGSSSSGWGGAGEVAQAGGCRRSTMVAAQGRPTLDQPRALGPKRPLHGLWAMFRFPARICVAELVSQVPTRSAGSGRHL